MIKLINRYHVGTDVRYQTLEGIEYLIAPMTIVVSGILNGSSGPLYYPPEELAKNAEDWNETPIVLDHPSKDGVSLSAKDPEVVKEFGLGILKNTRFESNKLISEAWIDVKKAAKLDPRILERIKLNEKIEVSTGLGAEEDNVPGKLPSGEEYVSTVRNYVPDHLAILLDIKGACSIDDGCGILNKKHVVRVTNCSSNKNCSCKNKCKGNKSMKINKVNLLNSEEVAEDTKKLIKASTEEAIDGLVTVITKAIKDEEEKKNQEKEDTEEENQEDEEEKKNKAKTKNKMKAKKNKEVDRDVDEEVAEELENEDASDEEDLENEEEEEDKPKENLKKNAMSKEQLEIYNYGKKQLALKKAELINKLTVNVTNSSKKQQFKKEFLGYSIEKLENLVSILPPEEQQQSKDELTMNQLVTNYLGQPTYSSVENSGEEEILDLPVFDFSK